MTDVKKVLYADDDVDDKLWVSEAWKGMNCSVHIEFVDNGRQVLDYLAGLPTAEMPSLIVLDLNMPGLDGRQTLKRLKDDSKYVAIPVVIVTTSSNVVDVEMCKRLGASLYLIKPDTHTEWQGLVRKFEPFIGGF
ncbi:response regulator [Paraflavisolibacter sp. H34]|uniref:response regulator n=1 Tax=Huijunlia imazamoxiresistens TaxID=3127457 RepID=UPI00301A3B01